MVTRTKQEDWIILQAEDHGYGVAEGTVFRWADSFCCQMVLGNGPSIAPSVDCIASYTSAQINRQLKIGAYAGVPLVSKDGGLFGTLCAVHPSPLPESIEDDLPLIISISKLLTTVVDAQLDSAAVIRHAEKVEAEALKDTLTGAFNRRAWDKFLVSEEERCLLLGHSACVVVADLDGLKQVNEVQGHSAGDGYLRRAAEALQIALASRPEDYVARTGGDEFSCLCVNCDFNLGMELVQSIERRLNQVGVSASIGLALRKPRSGLLKAWEEADANMYIHKQSKRASRSPM